MTVFEGRPHGCEKARREKRLKEVLDKMAQAESIARGLGMKRDDIDRLKREGLQELSGHLFG